MAKNMIYMFEIGVKAHSLSRDVIQTATQSTKDRC